MQRASGSPPSGTPPEALGCASADAPLSSLREAEAWIFDLDNTLYPASVQLFQQIDLRMRSYIADFLNLGLDEAFTLQKQYFAEYGTSMRGLMDLHGMDPTPFLAHVHDIDLSVLDPAPALDRALAALPGRKLVFTNASTAHAGSVLRQLGIEHHFSHVFDIIQADYRPKPEAEVYRRMLDVHAIQPRTAVMVEDMARNLVPAAALGMTTVWVRTGSEWAAVGADAGHIHYVVDDLIPWLTAVAEGEI